MALQTVVPFSPVRVSFGLGDVGRIGRWRDRMRLFLVPLLALLVTGCGNNNGGGSGGNKSDAGVGGGGPVTGPSDMAMSQNPTPGADMVSTGATCLATAMCAQNAKS